MKLAICIPCYGDPKGKFMQSLTSMIAHTATAKLTNADGDVDPVHMETFIVSGSMLTESRHRLVAEAMVWGADYMLCLDADHVFPHDTFCRLWTHGLPIVGANYARRSIPTAPTAAFYDDEGGVKLLYTSEDDAKRGLVEPAAHLGLGCVLINMRVFDVLHEHCAKTGDGNILPLFKFEPTESKTGTLGEDVFFFRKMKEAGITPFVDHRLSWEVGHISEMIVTNAHAWAQRDKWAAMRSERGDKFAAKADKIERESEEGMLQ